jgi:hypothetical protein
MIKTHPCACLNCQSAIPNFMLLCQAHWSMVPSRLRIDVKNAYREGREQRRHPTRQYLSAAAAAIAAVNGKLQAASARALAQQPGLQLT